MSSQEDLPSRAAFISNDDSPLPSANNNERRIPKSISWLLLILVIAVINIWYASNDLLPNVFQYAESNEDVSVVSSRQQNVTGWPQHVHNNFASSATWTGRNHSLPMASNHSNNNEIQSNTEDRGTNTTMTRLRQHRQNRSEALLVSNVTEPPLYDANNNETTKLRSHSLSTKSNNVTDADDMIAKGRCSFCQGEGRIFKPSIRLQGGYTCASIKQQVATKDIHIEKCKAFQTMENSCCPTGNWSHFWDKDNRECFHLNNICHAPNDEGWFYDSAVELSLQDTYEHQPTIAYDNEAQDKDRIRFNVSSTTTYGGNITDCRYSHTPHHVVSQSAYNHMIGEFYVRQIIGLNQWMRNYPPESDQDIKMYIHIPAKKSRLFDGHRLFMGALPHNGRVQDFVSLVKEKESCECYQTLAFCGYKKRFNTNASNSTDTRSRSRIIQAEDAISYKGISNARWCHGNEEGQLLNDCTTFNDFRQDLLERYATKDPLLPQKIRQYKHQLLLDVGVTFEDAKNESDWKIVGLAERKSRRVWLNIDDAIKACESFRHQKIVCIKVNVEQASSPEEQLLMHSSLDALVGIHGAQLTQGVLLPRHGYILELLPWIPDWSWGGWVARTNTPTPVGIMFHNTDLNHLGYALGRASVPLCKHLNQTEEEKCFKGKARRGRSFTWDVRDFEVEPDVITKFISSFVLQNSTTCDSMKGSANENDFVLYNAYCSDVKNEFSTQHYYRE